MPDTQTRHLRRQRACGFQYQIVWDYAGVARRIAVDGERQCVARCQPQTVADVGEHHEAFQTVIAVRTALPDAKGQVDLGRREVDEHVAVYLPPEGER